MKFLVNASSIYKKSKIKKGNLDYNVIFETSDNNQIHFTDLISLENFEKETLINLIKSKKIFFLLIIWTENTFIAITDQVASYNILYEKKRIMFKFIWISLKILQLIVIMLKKFIFQVIPLIIILYFKI